MKDEQVVALIATEILKQQSGDRGPISNEVISMAATVAVVILETSQRAWRRA